MSLPRLLVDFNDIRDGCCSGLVEDVEGGPVEPGARVVCHDEESHVEGDVVPSAWEGVVVVRMDWDTWTP